MEYNVDRISPSVVNVRFTLHGNDVAVLHLERKADAVSFDVTAHELFSEGKTGHASYVGGVAIAGSNLHVVAYWLDLCKRDLF
jgi:hypothetical protein